MTTYISCTFTFKFEVVFILFLVREFQKHLKRHAYFVMRRYGVGARNGCLGIAFKLSTFTSSLLRERTRNVYRYKTFRLFIACRDLRTFLFENVWVNRVIKGYFERKTTFEHAAELSDRGYSSGSNVTSLPVENVLFLGTVQSSSFEIASQKFDLSPPKTNMHSERSRWMFN